MLPICFGEATKYSQFLLEADKQYLVEARLGACTTTGDAEGEIMRESEVRASESTLLNILDLFLGEIDQIPSMYSALKYQGKPLYSYARQGIVIPRESRKVFIRQLSLEEFKKDTIKLLVTCSKGTYIRTLIEDIGEKLGCGAYVIYLRRTYVKPYQTLPMYTLETLIELTANHPQLDALLLPLQSALGNYPIIVLNAMLAFYVKQGHPVLVGHAPTSGYVQLFSDDNIFMGVGQVLDDGRIAPRRLIHI